MINVHVTPPFIFIYHSSKNAIYLIAFFEEWYMKIKGGVTCTFIIMDLLFVRERVVYVHVTPPFIFIYHSSKNAIYL
jgi:hypothetical protein